MAPDKHESITTRERLEFLLDDKTFERPQPVKSDSTKLAFLAGAAFSGLLAGSIFLTHYIDTKVLTPSATDGSSASAAMTGAVAAAGSAGAQAPVGAAASADMRSRTATPEIAAASISSIAPIPAPVPPPQPITVTPFVPSNQTQNAPLVKVPGLSTSKSVITGVVDPTSMTASYYWTFTLNNSTSSSKEAQMQIVLPDGAVVSRATLWINGKAEEAAFNSTWQVQNAYDWIVSRNRDPLLITQIGDNKISVKAAPVMPKKEMKIRIGMTVPVNMNGNGQCQMDLPRITDSNLDAGCVQNVHLTSDSPLFANNTHMNSPQQQKGFLLRGNVPAGELEKLQITMQRDAQMKRFATRATHSNPPGFIVAEVETDNQGLNKLNLTKTMDKPDCPVIADEHAAFRLSYLWAKQEINRLVSEGDQQQATDLATVYRVVSQVSGAVVLERQSDYEYNGLDRNMYKSLAYMPQTRGRLAGSAGGAGGAGPTQMAAPTPMAAPAPAAPMAEFESAPSSGFAAQSARPTASARRKAQSNAENKAKFDDRAPMDDLARAHTASEVSIAAEPAKMLPTLQSATNGTIAPQSSDKTSEKQTSQPAQDATSITPAKPAHTTDNTVKNDDVSVRPDTSALVLALSFIGVGLAAAIAFLALVLKRLRFTRANRASE